MGATRERRERRADRLEEWAGRREAKADAGFKRAGEMADAIPFGQPILVGHHSEGRDRNYRNRMQATGFRALEDSRKGEEMASKASNIRAAADHAIYTDDEDAVARLKERIAGWEAARDRIKAYNASCRKAGQCTAEALALLDAKQRADLASVAKVAAYQLGKQGQFPSYALQNLGGNITKARKRLPELEARAAQVARVDEYLEAERAAEAGEIGAAE